MSSTDERDGNAVDTTRVIPATSPDGDDIQVVPAGTVEPPGRPPQTRRIIVGAAIAAVVLLIVGIAIAARHGGSSSPQIRTATPTTPASVPAVAKAVVPKATFPSTVALVPQPAVVVTTVPLTSPPPASTAAPIVTPTTSAPTPTTAVPKQYSASVLTWSAPPSLTVASGKTASLSVTAHNPTNGTVTLAHPLSCTPSLDHGEMCAQSVQTILSGSSASATFTISASGFAAGHYTLIIEGVLTIPVTVS